MKATSVWVWALGVCVCILAGTEFAAAQKATDKSDAGKTATPAGLYKIGVVDRKAVLEKYSKVKAEYEKLQKEVEQRQGEIDKLSKKIQGEKDAYEAGKKDQSPAEQSEKEASIQSEYRQYQAELNTQQADIDSKERLLMKKVFAEIDEVVKKIGAGEGYHLILDGSSKTGAIYFSPTIDISQKVIDALNSK